MPDIYLHSFSDRLLLLMLALYVSVLCGGPLALHRFLLLDKPAALLRGLLAAAGRKLNRTQRSDTTRRLRGFLLVAVALVVGLGVGVLTGKIAETTRWSVVFEVVLVAYLLPMRASFDLIRELRRLLHEKSNEGASQLAASLGGRDEAPRDRHSMIRAGIEYLALQFSTRIVAPVFWYIMLGLPALIFVVALAVMDQLFGSRAKAYAAFGSTAARLDALAQLIPARISVLLLALAAVFSPGCNPARALKGAATGGTKTVSPNRGVILGAVAGTLGITLAGPRTSLGWAIRDEWIDFGPARVLPVHLARMLHLYAGAVGLLLLLVTALNLRNASLLTSQL